VGAGSGILSFFAHQSGAKRVSNTDSQKASFSMNVSLENLYLVQFVGGFGTLKGPSRELYWEF
jgi:hypothetical protein